MCIAFAAKPNYRPNKETLARCFERHPDGAGYAFAYKNQLVLKKGYFDFDQLYEDYCKIPDEATLMVHFRHASAGDITQANCHPFRIDPNHAFSHNGSFGDFFPDPEKTKLSDTGLYNEMLLKPLFKRDQHFWKTRIGHYLLCKTMGWSKIIIINNRGEFKICNEEAGLWDSEEKNVFWTNDSFLEFSVYYRTTLPFQLSLDFGEEADKDNRSLAGT